MPRKQKPVKIKRYRRSLSGGDTARTVKRVLLWVAVIAVLFAAGYYLTKISLAAWQNRDTTGGSSQASQDSSQDSSLPDDSTSGDGSGGGEPAGQLGAPHQSAAVSTSQLTAQYASALKDAGVGEAVLTIKNENGELFLETPGEIAQGSLAEGALTTAQLTAAKNLFAEHGITLTVRVCAYRDPLAPYTDRAAAVWFQGQENVLWLDNQPEYGGKPWLSPYSQTAQNYVKLVANQAFLCGIENVVVSWLQFPQVSSLGYTGYGAAAAGVAMNEILQTTTAEIMGLAQTAGASVVFEYPLDAASGENLISYTENPLTFGSKKVLVRISAQQAELAGAIVQLAQGEGVEEVSFYVVGTAHTDAQAQQIYADLLAVGAHAVLFE